jgi:biotin carboxylase
MSDRPTIAVLHAGMQAYREYLIAEVAEVADVWLLDDDDVPWACQYVRGIEQVGTEDVGSVRAVLGRLRNEHGVEAVIGWDELKVETVAQVASALGGSWATPAAVARCRDKRRTREALNDVGIPQPRSIPVHDADSVLCAAREIGLPIVVKPQALGASMGVRSAADLCEAAEAWRFASTAVVPDHPGLPRGVLVEEQILGTEISVDCVVRDGETSLVVVAHKTTSEAPYFEEIQHVVYTADPLLTDAGLLELLQRVHQALGFTVGCTHTELRRRGDEWVVIEVNARIGGDLIPYLGRLTLGARMTAELVAAATGRPRPAVLPPDSRCAAVRFLYPGRAGTVVDVGIDEGRLPAGTVTARVIKPVGAQVAPPPLGGQSSRWGYVVVVGDSPEECSERLDAASASCSLELLEDR